MTIAARAALVALVALVGLLVPTSASAQERTITFTVSAQGNVQSDLDRFAEVARATLSDPRGWALGGTIAFRQVSSGADFDLILASPAVVANAAPGCSAMWSCRVGRNVYINDERWRFSTQSWPHALWQYRRYVILHEVGHWLGLGHRDCPQRGRTAWVMQQQSISLQGCRANMWPVIAERDLAGRNQGVSVNWSAIERRYMALGQANGVLGAPITWETVAPDRRGRYQHYSRPGGASIYFTPQTGAHEIYGAIRTRWARTGWERGPLDYPTTGVRTTPDGVGRYTHFSRPGGASIYFTPQTGAHEIYGAIRVRWARTGWERGPLGYPVSGEYEIPGGRRSDFQHGYITWDRQTRQTEMVLTG